MPGRAREILAPASLAVVLVVLVASGPLARASNRGAHGSLKVAWLSDLGAEGAAATSRPVDSDGSVWVGVPGAVLAFSVGPDGSLTRRKRLATDFSSAYGLALSPRGTVVADRQGTVTLWRDSSSGPDPELLWRRPLDARLTSVSWNGGELVWATTRSGELIGLRSRDGERVWSVSTGGPAEAPAVGAGSDLFLATKDGTLLRIDAATGTILWQAELRGAVIHPPVLGDDRSGLVFCATWAGRLSAFEASTGNLLWSLDLGERLAGPPIAGFDRIAAVTDDGTVHVHDFQGELAWQVPDIAVGAASLLLSEQRSGARLLVVSKQLAALDLASGERIDTYPGGAVDDLRKRFVDAMVEGEKTYTEAEKGAALEREAFSISGPLFGRARRYGTGLAFGTEEGWVYFFDAASLRPTFRYRVGRAVSGMPQLSEGRLVAAAGEEVFALAPETGTLLWRRGVGGTVKQLVGGRSLAVLTGERLSTLDAADGSRGWTQRTRTRSVSAPSAAVAALRADDDGRPIWLIDDGASHLQALDRTGGVVGQLAIDGDALPAVTLAGEDAWLVATRAGRIFGVAWLPAPAGPGGNLERSWDRVLDTAIVDIRSAGARLLVRLEDGSLVGMAPGSGRELWRLRLAPEEAYSVARAPQALLVFGGDTVRVYDLATGRISFAREARVAAVGADFDGKRLRWLDREGRAHSFDSTDGRLLESTDLGVRLKAAEPSPAGFLIKTLAGEVGVVVDGNQPPAAAAPDWRE